MIRVIFLAQTGAQEMLKSIKIRVIQSEPLNTASCWYSMYSPYICIEVLRIIFAVIAFWARDSVNCFMENVSFYPTQYCVPSGGENINIINTLGGFECQPVEFII